MIRSMFAVRYNHKVDLRATPDAVPGTTGLWLDLRTKNRLPSRFVGVSRGCQPGVKDENTMPTFHPRRFSSPESLKTISPANLMALLLPFQDYLANRGLQNPATNGRKIDYETLVEILMNPNAAMPTELMDCLYYVHEISTPAVMIELLDETPPGLLTFPLGGDPTPADVAAQLWLKDRTLLERKHSEQYLVRPKSFTSYRGAKGSIDAPPPIPSETIACIQEEIDDWNEGHKRGRGSRVFVHWRDSEIWCLVRRPDPLRREGALEGGVSSGVYYHPEKFDSMIYSPALDTLQVSSGPKGQQQLYRDVFGKHLFGDATYFGIGGCYRLDPLRERGEDALDCSTIPGIQWIRLTQVEIFQGNGLTIRYSHTDLFALLGDQMAAILAGGRIAKASFGVKFVDSKTPRSVSVWLSSRASYMRDEDRLLVEAWMRVQGFLAKPAEAVDEEAEAALAGV
jgi:uncharacterized ParB-like nuclease family protein